MKKVNITIEQNSFRVREEIRTLRTNLQFCGDDKQVIMVTSSLPGEGKTGISIEIAHSLTELGKSVMLVDADMRKSGMASRLQVEGVDKGLSHFLSGQCALADAIVSTNVPKMHLLLAGPTAPNPTELLDTARFHSMIESMRKVYDYVIVDCPPLGLVIDAAVVARECDGAIIVVEAGKIKYRLVQSVKEQLEYAKIPILGVVLNKVERKKNPGYYNKYYGKGYKKGGYNTYYSSETQKK